jgi:hypothetical protein
MANPIYQPYIIIGMHRSGTTMVANALNDAGIFMGVFRDHNGEALHFLSLNQQMLGAENRSWLDPKVPDEESDHTLEPHLIYAEHIKSSSTSKLKLALFLSRTWGWKDPRNTFTLPLWLKRFPKAKIIHVIRDGRAVALSLANRNNVPGEVYDEQLKDLSFNFGLWEQYVQQGLTYRAFGKSQYLEIKYESLLAKEDETLASILTFTGVDIGAHLQIKKMSNLPNVAELNELASKSGTFKQLNYTV